MEYLQVFETIEEALGTIVPTPFVGTIDDDERVIYASPEKYGTSVVLIEDTAKGYFKPQSMDFFTIGETLIGDIL